LLNPMKLTNTLPLFFAIALVVSACGAPATPTIVVEDIQNTAVAAAFTIVAQTQAAIPTATSIPPTETPTQTPLPTDTPALAPTLEAISTATVSASSGGNGDPCNKVLQAVSGGRPAKIKLENNTGSPITVSLYLNQTPFGDCGFRGYTLGKGGSTLITDLVIGCYNVSVLVNDSKKPTKSFGYGCVNNPDKWTFQISRVSVVLVGR